MKIITGFEGSFEAETPAACTDVSEYRKIFEALIHNHEVAENVFARLAKSQLRG
jgi:hypothetical protein